MVVLEGDCACGKHRCIRQYNLPDGDVRRISCAPKTGCGMPRWPKRNPRPGVDKYGRAPIWYLASAGDVAGVRTALANGADANAGDDAKYTPLHVSAQEGRVEVITVLLGAGADPNVTDKYGNGPLWTAIMSA